MTTNDALAAFYRAVRNAEIEWSLGVYSGPVTKYGRGPDVSRIYEQAAKALAVA